MALKRHCLCRWHRRTRALCACPHERQFQCQHHVRRRCRYRSAADGSQTQTVRRLRLSPAKGTSTRATTSAVMSHSTPVRVRPHAIALAHSDSLTSHRVTVRSAALFQSLLLPANLGLPLKAWREKRNELKPLYAAGAMNHRCVTARRCAASWRPLTFRIRSPCNTQHVVGRRSARLRARHAAVGVCGAVPTLRR